MRGPSAGNVVRLAGRTIAESVALSKHGCSLNAV